MSHDPAALRHANPSSAPLSLFADVRSPAALLSSGAIVTAAAPSAPHCSTCGCGTPFLSQISPNVYSAPQDAGPVDDLIWPPSLSRVLQITHPIIAVFNEGLKLGGDTILASGCKEDLPSIGRANEEEGRKAEKEGIIGIKSHNLVTSNHCLSLGWTPNSSEPSNSRD